MADQVYAQATNLPLIKRFFQIGIDVLCRVPPSEGLAWQLAYVLENSDEMDELCEYNRKRALDLFSLDKVSDQWVQLIEKLVPPDYNMQTRVQERLLNV